ncbi:hypothetical protein RCOM_0542810 [Ricinus communis]|uniref:Uncharacterized protein n=1 Tax=Ricinus communis TaxID=3988 RepID=B9SKN7_RICCO|nr:hypothetical protein RCOM_0542810 [Ricinus communis]
MSWNYPEISLQELMKLIKGFVDIIILASGYQSSGLLAHWDPHNIKKAFQWASFFEHVLGQMSSSDVYQDSVKELDVALGKMTSSPSFPQGLADISFRTLNRARSFVLAHMFHTLPLRDSHLRAFLTAIIEMDLENVSRSEHDSLSEYLNKLIMLNTQFNLVPERRIPMKKILIKLEGVEATKIGSFIDDDMTKFTVQELLSRQSAVLCISTLGKGLDILSNYITASNWIDLDSNLSEEEPKHGRAQASVGTFKAKVYMVCFVSRSVDQLADFITWNCWKSVNLSYFLQKRTIRLVAGASMIFSGPKLSWVQVFEQMNASAKCKEDNDLCETIESGILEYLAGVLDGQLHQLWNLSPVLLAIAIPFWSPLFRLYLSEIQTQFKGDSSVMRCCSCIQERKEHEDCVIK